MRNLDESGAATVLGKPFVYLRIEFPNDTAIGPFRMGILQALQEHKRIAAAAKARGLKYRDVWRVVRYLNGMFDEPLVVTIKGRGGGVQLTRAGLKVLALFRESERRVRVAIAQQIKSMPELRVEASDSV